MKRNYIGTVLTVITFICALWATSAQAIPNYIITGYSASTQQLSALDGSVLNGGGVGQNGYYNLALTGGAGTSSSVGGLKGTFSLFD